MDKIPIFHSLVFFIFPGIEDLPHGPLCKNQLASPASADACSQRPLLAGPSWQANDTQRMHQASLAFKLHHGLAQPQLRAKFIHAFIHSVAAQPLPGYCRHWLSKGRECKLEL